MDTTAVLDIGFDGLMLAAKLAAPLLITALVVGFGVSLFDEKVQLRATWYETNQENVEETTLTNMIGQIVAEGYVRMINVTRLGLNPDPNGDGIPTEAGYVPPPQGLLDA